MARDKSVNIPGQQRDLGQGLYAVVETFTKKPSNNADDEFSNTLIGRFFRDEVDRDPMLYLCRVTGLVDHWLEFLISSALLSTTTAEDPCQQ